MPLPVAKRVIYEKNLLDRVICQLRFPPILKIEKEIPADFQDRIREQFPQYRQKEELPVPIPTQLQINLPGEFQSKNHEFSSEDGKWTVNLTRTFIALTTRDYRRWEDFQEHLNGPVAALRDMYQPVYFSRVGLRYIDIIRRSELGIDKDEPWSELLDPHLLGLLCSSCAVANDIRAFETTYELLLEDKRSVVRVATALAEQQNSKEEFFVIDSDFYNTEKTDAARVNEKLDYFHERASRLIQLLATEKLQKAMKPKEL
jgi:uncharacterized protein (TIGR04255 family)